MKKLLLLLSLFITYTTYSQGSIGVLSFGAHGDGTDETTQLQNALNSTYTSIYLDANKTYRFTSLTVPSNKTLVGSGGSVLKLVSGTPVSSSYRIKTANTTKLNVGVNIAIDSLDNTFTYSLASSKIAVNDIVLLTNPNPYYSVSPSEPYAPGWYGKAVSVSGSTVTVFPAAPMKFTATTLQVFSPAVNVSIENLTLDLSGGRKDFGITLNHALNSTIKRVVVKGDVPNSVNCPQIGIMVQGIGNTVSDSKVSGMNTQIPGYAFSAVGHYNTFIRDTAFATRHAISSAGRNYISTQINYFDGYFYGDGGTANTQLLDWHANAYHSHATGNKLVIGGLTNGGIQLRGRYDTAEYNNIAINNSGTYYGYATLFFENPYNSIARYNTITVAPTGGNNRYVGSGKVLGTPTNVRFINNVISTATSSAPTWMILSGNTASGTVTPPTQPSTAIANAGPDTLIYKNQSRPDTAFLSGYLSTGANTYSWNILSYPVGSTVPVLASSTSGATTLTGLQEGLTQVRLTVNGTVTDTKNIWVSDFMKKNVSPPRAGGGIDIIVPPTNTGTYTKKDGSTGTWNKWNYLWDLPAYLVSKGLPVPMGDDRLWFEGGADSTALIEIGNFGGSPGHPIYINPGHPTNAAKDKPINIRGSGSYFRIAERDSNVVAYTIVNGTRLRPKGYPYGFIVNNGGLPTSSIANGGINATWVHHFTVRGLKAVKGKWGVHIQINSSKYPISQMDKFIQRRVIINDNFIDSSIVEGIYNGSSDADFSHQSGYGPGARMDSAQIFDNIVLNSGWDGIQLANSRYGNNIYNNFVYRTGLATGDPSQQAGILMGANSNGNIYNNTVLRTRGNGIQYFGYGPGVITQNVVDSTVRGDGSVDAIFIRSSPTLFDGANNPGMAVTVDNNLIGRNERYYVNGLANSTYPMLPGSISDNILIYNGNNTASSLVSNVSGGIVSGNITKWPLGITYSNITTDANGPVIKVIVDGLQYTFSKTATATATAALNTKLFELAGSTLGNHPPFADAGKDTTIQLPSSLAILTGVGTDTEGAVQYSWEQISGPGSATISLPFNSSTQVSNLIEGTYAFLFTVTDSQGATSSDIVYVYVAAAGVPPYVPPGKKDKLLIRIYGH